MFDSPLPQRSQTPDLTKTSSGYIFTGGGRLFSQPEHLPARTSDLIATGTITSFQPFLSTDRTRVYSELLFKPEDILKAGKNAASPGTAITILQEGGTLRLPSGQNVSSKPIGGANPLEAQRRYMLFLNYSTLTKAYTVIKAWVLSGDHPIELDENGYPITGQNAASYSQTASEINLVNAVKEKLSLK